MCRENPRPAGNGTEQDARMELATARRNMIERQLRPAPVADERVLAAFDAVPREAFAPAAQRALAYADLELPLPCGQRMMTPRTEALLLQALAPRPGERILEVGAGSGFLAACMAALGARVDALELHAELAAAARAALAAQEAGAVTVHHADAWDWQPETSYDAVALTGSLPAYDPRFERWLDPPGRLLAIVGAPPVAEARLVHCYAPGQRAVRSLFELPARPLARPGDGA